MNEDPINSSADADVRKSLESLLLREGRPCGCGGDSILIPESQLLIFDSDKRISSFCQRQELYDFFRRYGFRVSRVQVLFDARTAAAEIEAAEAVGICQLLKIKGKWILISASVSMHDRTLRMSNPILPKAFSEVCEACWTRYRHSNRTCDANRMSTVFHSMCRLAEVKDDTSLALIAQQDFLEIVDKRYSTKLHKAYYHLKDDLRSAQGDTLLSIQFSAPTLALVRLKVGHPPCLWTDLLTCAKLDDDKWWIVAKTSCHEDFCLELKDEGSSSSST